MALLPLDSRHARPSFNSDVITVLSFTITGRTTNEHKFLAATKYNSNAAFARSDKNSMMSQVFNPKLVLDLDKIIGQRIAQGYH